MLAGVIFLCVFLTSILSGLVGMAGGVILMALLVATLPTASAMIMHGLIQAMANGSRVWFIRQHMQWHLMPTYFAGVVMVGVLFWFFKISWSAPVILIAIGIIAWLPILMPQNLALDVTRKPVTLLCGITVTATQLLAGTSGPLLDAVLSRESAQSIRNGVHQGLYASRWAHGQGRLLHLAEPLRFRTFASSGQCDICSAIARDVARRHPHRHLVAP